MKLRLMAAAIAGALAIAGAASAQPHDQSQHGHGNWQEGLNAGSLLRSLNLTDEQKTQMRSIEQTSRQSLHPLMQKLHEAQESEASTLLGTGTVTADTLHPTLVEENTLREQIETIRLNTLVQLRNVLTPAQLTQAASARAQEKQQHEQDHMLKDGPH